MPNVKWKAIPPVRGPNPQGVNYGNVHRNNKQVVTRKKVSNEKIMLASNWSINDQPPSFNLSLIHI